MTFPTIPTGGRALTTNQTGTSATRTFPNLSSLTKNSGDLLIAVIVCYQSTATANAVFSAWGGGFTEFVDQSTTGGLAIGAAYKVSTGSETGTFTVTEAATITGDASMILLSIPGGSGPPEATAIANGTTALADPVSLSPSWGALDTLWIVVAGNGETSATGSWTGVGTTAPTNYGSVIDTATPDNSLVGQVAAAVAFRQRNAASEDVGTWTSSDVSNARNSTLVIAVKPQPDPIATTELEGITDAQAWQQDQVRSDPVGTTNFADLVVGKLTDLPPDLVGISDSASVSLVGGGTDWPVTTTDPVGITDTRVWQQDQVRADSIGVTDPSALTQGKAFADPVGITETVDLLLDRFVDGSADPVGITDVASLVKSLTVNPADSIGITDPKALRFDDVQTDPVGVSDSTAVDQSKAFVETVGITDTSVVVKSLVVSQTDPVGLSDAATVNADRSTALSDPVGVTDSAQLSATWNPQPVDNVGITDAAALVPQSPAGVSPIDPVGLTDTVSLVVAHGIAPVDGVGIADSAATAAAMVRTISDLLGITDTATVGVPPTVSFNLTYDPLSPVLVHAVGAPTFRAKTATSPTLAHTDSDPLIQTRTAGTTGQRRSADLALAHSASTPRLE